MEKGSKMKKIYDMGSVAGVSLIYFDGHVFAVPQKKHKCSICGTVTADWEKVGGIIRCWSCGKLVRMIKK